MMKDVIFTGGNEVFFLYDQAIFLYHIALIN
jgi:hypothetical protein